MESYCPCAGSSHLLEMMGSGRAASDALLYGFPKERFAKPRKSLRGLAARGGRLLAGRPEDLVRAITRFFGP